MRSHPNMRLTQRGRRRLVIQHVQEGRPLAELAAENGISLRRACRWLARYRAGGVASLADRRSVRRTQRRTLDPQNCSTSGAQVPAPASPGHCPPAPRSLFHRRQDPEPTWSGPTAKPGPETAGSALQVGEARRSDPHRRQITGQVPQGGAPDHRRPTARPVHWRRLRQVPCHRRRRDTARLYQGPGRRAEANRNRLSQPGHRLVQRSGHRVPAGDERQRACLRLQRVRQGLPDPGAAAHPHQALHAQD